MSDSAGSRWFKIVVFLLTTIAVVVCISNIIYFNRMRDGTSDKITHGEATTMFWVNIILLVLAAIVWIWSIWALIFHHDTTINNHYMGVSNQPIVTSPQPQVYSPPPQVYSPPPIAVATSTDSGAMIVAPGEQNMLSTMEGYE